MPNTDRKLRVFLCHASQDKSVVRELYQRLHSEGWIDPWLDEEKLLPGQDWGLEVEKAVEMSDVVIVCLSNSSVTKEGYLQKELRLALSVALTKLEETIYIVPLRLDNCPSPRRLQAWQYADYFPVENRERAYSRLLNSFKIRSEQLGIKNASGKMENPKSVNSLDTIRIISDTETSHSLDESSKPIILSIERQSLQGHDKQVNSLAFSLDGSILFSGGGGLWGTGEKQIFWWDLWKNSSHNYENIGSTIWCVASSPTDLLFATGSSDARVRLWDANGKMLREFEEHLSPVTFVSFLADGKGMISLDRNGYLIFWDIFGGGFIRKLEWITGIAAFSPKLNTIAIAKKNGAIELWQILDPKQVWKIKENDFLSVSSIAFSQTGEILIVGLTNNSIEVRETKSGKLLQRLDGHKDTVKSLSVSFDNTLLVSGSNDQTVRLWDLYTGKPLHSFVGHTGGVLCLAFSPDDRYLASGSTDKTIKLWNLSS